MFYGILKAWQVEEKSSPKLPSEDRAGKKKYISELKNIATENVQNENAEKRE